MANEAFARVKVDQLLKAADWRLTDGRGVPLNDAGKADYALFDRQGRALAVLEAKSTSVNLGAGEAQGLRYAAQLDAPLIFLSNGGEVQSYGRRGGSYPAKTAHRRHRLRHLSDARVGGISSAI